MHKQEFEARISSQGTISLPKHLSGLTNHTVKVVIYEIGSKKVRNDGAYFFGALHQYANPSKIDQEQHALINAMKKKHDTP